MTADQVAPTHRAETDEFDRRLLQESGLFDDAYYRAHARLPTGADAMAHYLRHGWKGDLQPNADFPGEVLQPCFESVGLQGAAAVTWLTLAAAGWPLPGARRTLDVLTMSMLETGLFDERHYRTAAGLHDPDVDAISHYAVVGEKLGFSPSPDFDPGYYGERNADVSRAGMSPLLHYAQHGRAEGRRGRGAETSYFRGGPFEAARENVILVVHETSRTGAPILGWNIGRLLAARYNVFTIRMGDGELTAAFETFSTEVHGPFLEGTRHPVDVEYSLRNLLDARRFRYAIVNSAESRLMLEACAVRYIPTLLLMHEFGSYVNPAQSLREAFDWAAEIVFPARVVQRAAQDVHPILQARRCAILPQGMSIVPAAEAVAQDARTEDAAEEDAAATIIETLTQARARGDFIVLGAGTVHIRKGVDLFLTAAAAAVHAAPNRRLRFLWIGHGFDPVRDVGYSVYLQEQLQRSGLQDHVTIADEVSNLEPFYALAHVFLLTSRLDPLPNVSIDASLRGLPIVCFRDASGIAELLLDDPETAEGVVAHLDASAAAQVIVGLAADEKRRQRLAVSVRRRGEALFDMGRYVDQLDALGHELAPRMAQQRRDADILAADAGFDQDMVLGLREIVEPRERSIARHMALAAARGWSEPPVADTSLRRPAPGFNPQVWAALHPLENTPAPNPFAEFVRRGRPAGPWQINVLSPPTGAEEPAGAIRAALHAHMFYPELAKELLAHLDASRSRCDLFVTTDTESKAELLMRSFSEWDRGAISIRAMPNRGRDLGPMLTGLRDELAAYDVVGHVHSKRSLASFSDTLGDSWRAFLWENLLGGRHAMLDQILAAFEVQPDLGLVFPADPHLVGWDENRPAAEALAARLKLRRPLPGAFDFPLGTMFWMRRPAFIRLAGLDLGWDDYPPEPLPYDGSALHALERLMPFVSEAAGHSCAVTHVPGITW